MDINYKQLNEHVPIEDIYNQDYHVLNNILYYQMMYDNHLKIIYDYLMQDK